MTAELSLHEVDGVASVDVLATFVWSGEVQIRSLHPSLLLLIVLL